MRISLLIFITFVVNVIYFLLLFKNDKYIVDRWDDIVEKWDNIVEEDNTYIIERRPAYCDCYDRGCPYGTIIDGVDYQLDSSPLEIREQDNPLLNKSIS